MHPRLVYLHLHHVPVPGNLREQSKSYRRTKVCQRRWRGIVSAHGFPLITVNGKALLDERDLHARNLPHLFQGFGIHFENKLSGAQVRVEA
jgi:hypothetical protein